MSDGSLSKLDTLSQGIRCWIQHSSQSTLAASLASAPSAGHAHKIKEVMEQNQIVEYLCKYIYIYLQYVYIMYILYIYIYIHIIYIICTYIYIYIYLFIYTAIWLWDNLDYSLFTFFLSTRKFSWSLTATWLDINILMQSWIINLGV